MYAYTYISLCVCAHTRVYTFYETEMIPAAEVWGDDLMWQECQNHWIHPSSNRQRGRLIATAYWKILLLLLLVKCFLIPRE